MQTFLKYSSEYILTKAREKGEEEHIKYNGSPLMIFNSLMIKWKRCSEDLTGFQKQILELSSKKYSSLENINHPYSNS